MALFCCNLRINVEERCLDEKLIGTARQRDDSVNVLTVIASVDHVGDFLSTRCTQGVLLEQPKRKRQLTADCDVAIIWLAPPYRTFGLVEPWPDWKLELFQPFAPDIDAQLLLECKGKAGNAVIEHGAKNPKILLIEERSGRQADQRHVTSAQGFPSAEFADPDEAVAVKLGDPDHEIE